MVKLWIVKTRVKDITAGILPPPTYLMEKNVVHVLKIQLLICVHVAVWSIPEWLDLLSIISGLTQVCSFNTNTNSQQLWVTL